MRLRAMRAPVIGFAAIAAAALPARAAGPQVRVEQGVVEGEGPAEGSTVSRFLGIPYAAPPVGALRWRAPEPAPAWRGVRKAQAFGDRCVQPRLWDDLIYRSKGMSEDCLSLNVWTPTAKPASGEKWPVLLYIYGGGYLAGDSSEPRYDGASMAARGMVVVSMNYRLGAFGFLAHPWLSAESGRGASGNYGLMDQAAALHWVRRNIAAFGGDPARITIGGESAGSMSVSAMLVSPLTRQHIAGAIAESGALMTPVTPLSLPQAEAIGQTFLQEAKAENLRDLRALSAERVMALQGNAAMRFGAIVDGHYLTEQPSQTYARGQAARVPLLIGSNSQELGYEAVLGREPATVAGYRAALARLFGSRAPLVERLYPAGSDAQVPHTATVLSSDRFLGLATWKLFDLHRQSGAPTYYYYYSRIRPPVRDQPERGPRPLGALHSAEIEYALGNLDINPRYAWTPEDRRVSATMQGYFANFVRAADPNGAGLPRWPRAVPGDGMILRQHIDVDTRTTTFVEQQRYRAMEPLILTR
ncbi:carboxylesterase/lipase family protein [Sphingomonas sp.]|uniref:carboxylesterase/lipase family protein n=1 Tax=Sphingomonas sp. TaxID=28214 RepID=UPI003B3BD7AC